MEDNFKLFDKYPQYVFNFSGANRYRLMKEYFPADFAKAKSYVNSGRWFPAGSSIEGDVNAPSAEAIVRQVLHRHNWFRKGLFRRFRKRWCEDYPAMLKALEKDLPELLSFFSFPRHLWRKLRTTNIIERVFVEVRRRTRLMVCFVNVAGVDRIIYSIFHRFNLEWRNRTLRVFTPAA